MNIDSLLEQIENILDIHVHPVFQGHVVGVFVAELCAVEHEPFMRMRPHRLHAVFHGEVAVGSPGTVFGGFLQTVYDFVLYLEREASPGAEL